MTAHDPRSCAGCQEMVKRGGYRIIDLLGHGGFLAFNKAMEGFPGFTGGPSRWAWVREAWAQAAAVITEEWSGFADEDAPDLDRILADVYACTRTWDAWGYGTMSEDDFQPATEAVRDDLLRWRDAAVRRALAVPAATS